MTIALIVINVIVSFFLQPKSGIDFSGNSLQQGALFHYGAIPYELTHPGQHCDLGTGGCGSSVSDGGIPTWATVFTGMFTHAGLLHLGGNMLFLWIFGNNVEDSMGPVRFVVFYLLGGIAALALQVAIGPDSTVPTLGASGAIAGVMGAYFLLFPHSRIIVMFPLLFLPLFFELPAVTYLAVWALSQVFSGSLSLAVADGVGGIAWWAHVGGFAAGLILQFFFVRRGRDYRPLARDEYGDEAAWVPAAQWRRHG